MSDKFLPWLWLVITVAMIIAMVFCLSSPVSAMTPEELKQAHDLCQSRAFTTPPDPAVHYTLSGCEEISALWEIRRKQDADRDQGILNELMKR